MQLSTFSLKKGFNRSTNESEIEMCFWMDRKQFGKRRKCWLPPSSPFPKMISKAFFFNGC